MMKISNVICFFFFPQQSQSPTSKFIKTIGDLYTESQETCDPNKENADQIIIKYQENQTVMNWCKNRMLERWEHFLKTELREVVRRSVRENNSYTVALIQRFKRRLHCLRQFNVFDLILSILQANAHDNDCDIEVVRT